LGDVCIPFFIYVNWDLWGRKDIGGRANLFAKVSPFPDFSRDVLLAKLTAQLAVQTPPLPQKNL